MWSDFKKLRSSRFRDIQQWRIQTFREGGGHPDPEIRVGPGLKKEPPLYKKVLEFQLLNEGLIYMFSS